MIRNLLFSFLLTAFSASAWAQHTFSFGEDNTLELGGRVAVFYNQRFLKPGEDNYKKNRFALRDLQLDLEGRKGNAFEYRLQVDFADLATNSAAGMLVDPENPGLMKAYISYHSLPVNIKLGYDKIPYSQASMDNIYGTPFWSRGILTDGSLFTRRDLGLTLSSNFWKQRINLYAGVYSGLGENILATGDNDASGKLEYAARADVSWPSRFRYNEIDEAGVPIPLFRVGGNMRYADKSQPGEHQLPAIVNNEYNLRVIDGKKQLYGFDATFAYRHFSAQFEYQHILIRPAREDNILFAQQTRDIHQGKVNAGGYLVQANYYWLKANSVFSVRYQNVNLNDLVYGRAEWLHIAYAYTINGFNNVIKIQYYKPLTEDEKSDPVKYTDQIRIGWQHRF